MKKTTMIVTIVLILVVAGAVGVYAYLSGRARTERQEAVMTEVDKVLYRDLNNDYPGTVKEVVKYYSDIVKCFYADGTTEEQVEKLGMKARELYDDELLEINPVDDYLLNLVTDVQEFKSRKRVITSYSVASSVNVDTFQEDGYSFARLNCTYSILEDGVTNRVSIIYLLRQDENRRWKIYGWDNASNVNIQ